MKDGYYLSTYIHIDELCNLMNIELRHDHAIALWKKENHSITLVHYWELERITGIKQHSNAFRTVQDAKIFINKLLERYKISLDNIEEIWGTPLLDTDDTYYKLDNNSNLALHSVSQLFSTIFFDTNKFYDEKILGLAVDCEPDNVLQIDADKKSYYTGCIVNQGQLSLFPISSPGMLWAYARRKFGYREGSLMALGTASKSEAYLDTEEVNMKINDISAYGQVKNFIDTLVDEIWELSDEETGIKFSGFDEKFSLEENRISMVIKEIQKLSIRIMNNNIEEIQSKFNISVDEYHLALAGGFALNCPSNDALMTQYKFKSLIVPPCVYDCGMALGIGLYVFYKKLQNERVSIDIKTAYYGDKDSSLEELLADKRYFKYIEEFSELHYEEVIKDIIEYPIVWFNGSAEMGPRALGNRSLLADPRSNKTKDILNQIKKREWWRPVAPIVLQEYADRYFYNCLDSPFMLRNFKVVEELKEDIPGILHIDNSSRVQTISEETNSDLYHVIKVFYEHTNIPILCNTSLNDINEPIINKIEEAINFALRKKIPVIYVNKKRIKLCKHEEYTDKSPLDRDKDLFTHSVDTRRLEELNPFGLNKEELEYYYINSDIRRKVNLDEENGIKHIKTGYRIFEMARER